MDDIVRALYVKLARKEHAMAQVFARTGGVSLCIMHGPVTLRVGDLSVSEALALADALIEAARLAGPAEETAAQEVA